MLWVRFASVLMFLGVALGAFVAHSLRGRVSEDLLPTFETGVRYHFYHALALFAVAWLSENHPGPWITLAGWAFVLGILLFSGSLYVLTLTGARWWGAVTPIGGLALLVGWVLLAIGAFRG